MLVEAAIPETFESLAESLRSTTGRMTAANIEDRVKKVLDAWTEWSIFPASYTGGLRAIFMMTEADCQQMQSHALQQEESGAALSEAELVALKKQAKSLGIASSEKVFELQFKVGFVQKKIAAWLPTEAPADVPGSSYQAEDVDNLDGVPLSPARAASDCVDGEDIDGAPMSVADDVDIDGAPLDDVGDVDGVPMDGEDIDGVPLDS